MLLNNDLDTLYIQNSTATSLNREIKNLKRFDLRISQSRFTSSCQAR